MPLKRNTWLFLRFGPKLQLLSVQVKRGENVSNVLVVKVGMAKVVHCTDRQHDIHPELGSVVKDGWADPEYLQVWSCHKVFGAKKKDLP